MNNNYKIVIDSSGELPEELKKDGHFSNVKHKMYISLH